MSGAASQAQASAAASASASVIPFKRDSDVPSSTFIGGGVGVLLISLLAIVVVQWLRKRLHMLPGSQGPRLLQVLESQRLGPRTTLLVVQFAGRRYLLAQGEHGVQCLDSVPGEGAGHDAA